MARRPSSKRQHHLESPSGLKLIEEPSQLPVAAGASAPKKRPRGPISQAGKKNAAHAKNFFPAAAIWLGMLHVGALAAPWTFTWSGLVMVVVLHWLCGGIGICMGFHRLLTHTSFATYRPIRFFLALCGSFAGEGSPSTWVANHRLHHALSDQDGDPHSPRDGAWWSHVFWLAYRTDGGQEKEHIARWAPDLAKDPWLRWLDSAFLPVNIALTAILMGIGYAIDGWPLALSYLVWGTCVRMVLVLHTTWLVNSASHMWGYKNYEIKDDSRNNWLVAIISYGEGWHNNHHAYPRMAKHGHKWWEFDMTFLTIRLMQKLGLVWDVVDYRHVNEREEAAA